MALPDRLYADLLAARLRDPESFLAASTSASWPSLEIYARRRAASFRGGGAAGPAEIDRALKALRSSLAGGVRAASRRDVSVLTEEAGRLLEWRGSEMVLAVDRADPGREILRWRYVSLALPPGILAAADSAARGVFAPPANVRLLHRSFAPDSPVAQQHVHHAAMMSFEELWASLGVRAVLEPGALEASLRDPRARCPGLHPGACPSGRDERSAARHMDRWAGLLRQAFVAARVLERHAGHRGGLDQCESHVCATGRARLAAFLQGSGRDADLAAYPWPSERLALGRRCRQAREHNARQSAEGGYADLLEDLATEERRRLVHAFRRTEPACEASGDLEYERLLLQYLRVKTAVYALVVHSPGEPGLRNFLRHFQQIKVYAPEADQLSPRRPHEPGLDVRSTEYRVAPDAWLRIVRPSSSRSPTELPARSDHESAWLIHFKRAPGSDRRVAPFFYSAVRSAESDAERVIASLEQDSRRLRDLRGIDICGVEEDQPLWVSAQTLMRVRSHVCRLARRRPSQKLRPLGLTLHAGEDFQWLTSGVRAIAEPFHWALLQRGDRIGHGIAVTVDPDQWWRTNRGRSIEVSRFDRLLDLAFLAEYAPARPAGLDAWLRRRVADLARELALPESEGGYLRTALRVWRDLGSAVGRRLLLSARPPVRSEPHAQWLHRYFWDRSMRELAGGTVSLSVGGWQERALLRIGRERLISDLARWQVSIESNPSSNLVVAGLEAMSAQDFLARRPTESAPRGRETLIWTISTDDPITFSTTLADEYAYAWAGMVLRPTAPYDPSYARALLDEAASNSMRTRFTGPG